MTSTPSTPPISDVDVTSVETGGSSSPADGLPVEQMRRWYLAGESNATIGSRLGLHHSKVRRVLLGAGVTMRTRREQVALQDQRAGVTVPACVELVAGYLGERLTLAELAERHGISSTRLLQMLRDCGIERRQGRPRAEWTEADRARRRPPELVAEILELYRSGLSRTATARRVGLHKAVVADVLRRVGVELRDRRKLAPVEAWAHRYWAGETAAQVAATYGVRPEAVYRAMEAAGIERRPGGAPGRTLSDDDVVACYVDEGLSLAATARRLNVSIPRVREVVARLGVLRAPFDPTGVDRRRFARRWAAGASYGQLGAEFGLTEHQVTTTVRAFKLPGRQPGAHRALSISDRQLSSLVIAGYSDTDIARRYQVAVWAVVRRRRRSRLLRPPPNRVRPPVGRTQLERQLAAGVSRAEIATAHHVGLATVTRWCAHYQLDVVGPSRPVAGRDVELDPGELRHLYIDERWTAHQIAEHFGVDQALITFALHSHRIPVRHGGHGTQHDAVVLLDALYADADIVAVLRHHSVLERRRAGTLAHRFPHPPPLTGELVEDLYRMLGLSTTHVSLLTGHSASNVLETLRRHGIPSRSGSRSPWFERTLMWAPKRSTPRDVQDLRQPRPVAIGRG